MERRRALGLAARHVALSWGALILGAVLVAAGLLSASSGAMGLVDAIRGGSASGLLDAMGATGVALLVAGVLVVVLGRVAALHYFVTRTVRAALDEEVARIERELAREIRGVRRSAEEEDLPGRLDALEREVERLRTGDRRGAAPTQDAVSGSTTERTDAADESESGEEAAPRPPEQQATGTTASTADGSDTADSEGSDDGESTVGEAGGNEGDGTDEVGDGPTEAANGSGRGGE